MMPAVNSSTDRDPSSRTTLSKPSSLPPPPRPQTHLSSDSNTNDDRSFLNLTLDHDDDKPAKSTRSAKSVTHSSSRSKLPKHSSSSNRPPRLTTTAPIPDSSANLNKQAREASDSFETDAVIVDKEDLALLSTAVVVYPNPHHHPRKDKAAKILGIPHRKSMEPVPASPIGRASSVFSIRSLPTVKDVENNTVNIQRSASASVPPKTPSPPASPSFTPSLPLTSLYVVSGLPKSPQTWTLADPDTVHGLTHSDGAVNRWWRAEVLGSTVTNGIQTGGPSAVSGAGGNTGHGPGVGNRRKKSARSGTKDEAKGLGALPKQETAKMLSKALKLSFTREIEIIASTLQPASTVHTFTFTLPASSSSSTPTSQPTPVAPGLGSVSHHHHSLTHAPSSTFRNSFLSANASSPYTLAHHGRPSTAYLGPSASLTGLPATNTGPTTSTTTTDLGGAGTEARGAGSTTYHGVCLTVWSHADAQRSAAIRRQLESGSHQHLGRARKESAHSLVAARLKALRGEKEGADRDRGRDGESSNKAKVRRKVSRGATTDGETDLEHENDPDADVDSEGGGLTVGMVSESEYDFDAQSTYTVGNRRKSGGGSRHGHNHGPGESTLFLPGDTVFWLPYALTLVSRFPIYDLMRDYLTLSWARFSKDVGSHTLQISKILSHPAPRAGDVVRLDASPIAPTNGHGHSRHTSSTGKEGVDPGASLEVVTRFPGGLDFGRGLVDINFTMWPLFKCLSIDTVLSICEIALAPTGRVLFYSRHPAMLGIAVATIKYLVELRGWNGIALPTVHSRDAKIYVEDPGPWIIGLAAEMRYAIRPSAEVCVCDLDINYLSCANPPPGSLSVKQQRERYRQRLLAAFGEYYHPDHSVPIEFKEAFPAGRFRPICKIQAKCGASSTIITESIKAPEWWHSTRIIQAFDAVLLDRLRKPSFLKRISSFRSYRRIPQLTYAEQQIQLSIRKRATAFVDARDDLETKIGRLSRRLNFLMTESDLWREKFVTFEQYAEKLSNEATDLRSKISKEQRESRRLTGLISLTAVEKLQLQTKLHETETAHKNAAQELDEMREQMEKMEEERALMVAEVEAQIERALAAMAVGMNDLEDDEEESYDSRPVSPGSIGSEPSSRPSSRPTSRRPSRSRPMRSFSTESTLAEHDEGSNIPLHETTIQEDEEPESVQAAKRFSVTSDDQGQDAMAAVDEGIHDNSDRIGKRVLQIQQKLEIALAADHLYRQRTSLESQSSGDDKKYTSMPRLPSGRGKVRAARTRSSTVSSSRTTTQQTLNGIAPRPLKFNQQIIEIPTGVDGDADVSDNTLEAGSTPVMISPSSPIFTPSTPATTNAATEDSDTDFQSAYSTSPRDSYISVEGDDTDKFRIPGDIAHLSSRTARLGSDITNTPLKDIRDTEKLRERVSSTATAVPTRRVDS